MWSTTIFVNVKNKQGYVMANSSITHRRKVRDLEAKRDRLIESTSRNKGELQKVRAELKHVRKTRV